VACFYVIEGVDKGLTVEASGEELVIGRGDDSSFSLRDGTVSRRHARVRNGNGRWFIEDLGSSNGTYVNGVRIAKAIELKSGDQIRAGKTVLMFSEDQPMDLLPEDTDVGSLIDVDVGRAVDSAIMAAIPSDQAGILAEPEAAEASAHLRVIYNLMNVIQAIFNVEQLLHRVMDIIFEEIPADRGFILMVNEKTARLEPMVVRYRDQRQPSKITTSKTIVQHVLTRHEGVLCSNAMADARFSKGESIQNYALQSVICVPIMVRDKVLGIIHIDSAMGTHTYSRDQLRLMTAIGYQTGLAVHNAQMYLDSIKAERLAAIGETVASLSHYVKNILQALRGGADVVEMGIARQKLETVRTGWQIVGRNMDKIHNLMLNMLTFSKDREPKLEPIQINAVVSDVIELMQSQADDKGVLLVSDPEQPMPAIPADPEGVHRVVLNLLINALDAVPESTGVITVRTHYDEQNGEAQIIVGDNGAGIPKDDIDKIFDIFHSTKGHGGTGLGLTVARKIVEEHGGKIDVTSHVGEGTVFTVRLPVVRTSSAEATAGPEDTV